MRISHFAICLPLMLGCLVSVTTAGDLRTVALFGDAAPGAGSGALFSQFSVPVLNNASQVAFRGKLFGNEVGASNNVDIWSEGNGSLELVAREGDRAPGTSRNFSGLNSPVLNDAGQTAFFAFLADSAGNSSNSSGNGIWSEGSGSLDLVTREGNGAPGTGVSFSDFGDIVLNNAGQTVFVGFLTGTEVSKSNDTGICGHIDPLHEPQLAI